MRISKTWLAACFAWCSLLLCACGGDDPQVGGETHWLMACGADAECGDGLQCVCGSCTRACASDASCEGSKPAACYDMGSPLLLQRCPGIAAEALGGVCLPSCSMGGAQCGSTRSCVENACLPADESSSSPSGDAGSDAVGPVALPPISDFDAVEADILWSEAITLPERSVTIEGADAPELVGTWTARGCDAARVVGPAEVPGCRQLVIRSDGAGVTGHLQFLTDPPALPLPPVDPDAGYPPGLSADEVSFLSWLPVAGVAYRLRDGRFHDGIFEFVWSPFDVFRDWCAAQTPQLWSLEGHRYYFCAPQDPETQAQLDSAKLDLCLHPELRPGCDDGSGQSGACLSIAACRCEPDRCEVDTQLIFVRGRFAVEGSSMTGSWAEASNAINDDAAAFDKEEP